MSVLSAVCSSFDSLWKKFAVEKESPNLSGLYSVESVTDVFLKSRQSSPSISNL